MNHWSGFIKVISVFNAIQGKLLCHEYFDLLMVLTLNCFNCQITLGKCQFRA